MKRARKFYYISVVRKPFKIKLPKFHYFSNFMIFPCMEKYSAFSIFSRACGNPDLWNARYEWVTPGTQSQRAKVQNLDFISYKRYVYYDVSM